MVARAFSAALVAAALAGSALAADGPKGSRGSPCPKETPCCSLYGDCGVGAFCLGGCDPTMSTSFDSCVPNPVCQDQDLKLNSMDDVAMIENYLGDASKANWQGQGDPQIYQDSTLLTMAQGTVGTLYASTHYVWYGKICATLSTAQGRGVVTAFILMSDVKDEIDFEWVGTDVDRVQSNYYAQGNTNYQNSKNLTVSSSTAASMHEYCFDWSPDKIDWIVDNNVMRTQKREGTWNATANRYDFPQTPARVMLSLWPAGLPSNPKGVRDWAGGEIDWSSKYMQQGYYFARFSKVSIKCYDPPAGVQKQGSKTYKYTSKNPTNNTVAITDKVVILGSLMGTGDNPGEAPKSGSPKPSETVAMIPGGNPGGGVRAEATSAPSSNPNSPQASGSSDSTSGFNQGTSSTKGSAASAIQPGLARVAGGVLAVTAALLGLIVL